MSSRAIAGTTCRSCRTEFVHSSPSCPNCGKLDLTLLRRQLARAIIPYFVFFGIIFAAIGALTAIAKGPAWIASLSAAIDDQFKPPVTKKK